MKEVYKPIKGYEGQYAISNYGNVRSTPVDGKPTRLLKQETTKRNHTSYRRVALCKNGKVTRFSVHRLVAITFITRGCSKPHINHKDSNGENNSLKNLEWCTHSENMIHAAAVGNITHHKTNGTITGDKKIKATAARIKKLMGSIPFVIHPVDSDSRTYITFQCQYCSQDYTGRSDAKSTNEVACNSCLRKHKHI